ncbi:HYR domain-containing protein [Pyxidicoccus sp. 3LFB2]
MRDTTPPAITCESFIGTEATSSEGAVVTVPEPVWYDVASNTVTFTYSPAPGPTFPLGATFRQAIPTDEAGNVGQACTTVVVVQDTTPPAVTCSADLVVEATGPEGAAVSYAPPSATDAVTSAPTLSATHASGSVFPTGITRVTVTATDGAGNAGTCAFNVTVQQPPPPPSITCPADVLTEATGPQGATVTYPAATASDGRAPVVVTYSHDSGAGFPVGDTTVTATARDAEGRTASCAFTVTVRDTTPPSLTCPADLTVVATGGSAEVFYPPVSVSDVVTPASAVTVFFSPLSGSRFSLGTSTVNVTATDVAGNPASCTFTVTVVPRPLVITCPSDQVVEATSPEGAVVHYGPALVSEGSPPYTVTYSQAAGTRFSKGTTSVTASVQDSQGSGGSCTFSVTVRDTTPPELTCPAVLEFEATSSAGAIADVPAPTWVDAGSAAVTFTHAPAPGSTFSLGATPRIATGTDEAGNTRTCTTVVVVKDTTPPAVTCGADLVVEAPAQDGAAVTYAAASATDAVTSAPTLSASHASGSVFPIGITRVTVTATDGAGNAATCGFNITVQALPPPPSITCPANGVAEATGAQGASVSWAPATSSGGRLPVTLSYSHDSGMGFPLGTTAITATARDSDGRDASCTFAVTVSDTTPPAITCPSDVTVTSVSTNGQAVDFPFATAEDGVSAPEVVSSHASGSLFPPGTTPVVMTATDASGNSASCTLQVTVGTRKPVSVETPESASLGFGCSTGTGASAAVGWSLLLLAGLMRRRGAQQR